MIELLAGLPSNDRIVSRQIVVSYFTLAHAETILIRLFNELIV